MAASIVESNINNTPKRVGIVEMDFNPETNFADNINQKAAGVSQLVDLSDVYDYAGGVFVWDY